MSLLLFIQFHCTDDVVCLVKSENKMTGNCILTPESRVVYGLIFRWHFWDNKCHDMSAWCNFIGIMLCYNIFIYLIVLCQLCISWIEVKSIEMKIWKRFAKKNNILSQLLFLRWLWQMLTAVEKETSDLILMSVNSSNAITFVFLCKIKVYSLVCWTQHITGSAGSSQAKQTPSLRVYPVRFLR